MSFKVVQERDAIPGRPVVLVTVVALVVTAIAIGIASRLLGGAGERAHGPRVSGAPTTVQGMIEQSPLDRSDRGAARRQEAEARLGSYGWVDDAHQLAHIPITRAMELYLEAHADGGTP